MMGRPSTPPSDEAFRKAGFAPAAKDCPRSDLAMGLLCAFNGVKPGKAPPPWWYHANNSSHAAWERVAQFALSINPELMINPMVTSLMAAAVQAHEIGIRDGLEMAAQACVDISQDWETCVHTNSPDWAAYARGADECTDVIRDLMNGTPPEDGSLCE